MQTATFGFIFEWDYFKLLKHDAIETGQTAYLDTCNLDTAFHYKLAASNACFWWDGIL